MRLVFRCHIDISFRILFCTDLTVPLFVSLSSLPIVERTTASVTYFISSILRKSKPRNFLSYLRRVSAYYSRLEFFNVNNNIRLPKFLHFVVPRLSGVFIKSSVDGIAINPRLVHREPIP